MTNDQEVVRTYREAYALLKRSTKLLSSARAMAHAADSAHQRAHRNFEEAEAALLNSIKAGVSDD